MSYTPVNALRYRTTPQLSERFESPKRDDTSMDIDQPWGSSYGQGSGGQGMDDGPSRKRHHGLHGPSPFTPSAFAPRPVQQYNDSPFLFAPQHVPPAPPALPPFSQYNADNLKFDMATLNTIPPARTTRGPDIEMEDAYTYKTGTPQKHDQVLSGGHSAGEEAGPGVEVAASAPAEKAPERGADDMRAKVEDAPEEKRPIAKGAVSRTRKRRAKEWKRRYDTDTEGEEENARRGDRAPAKTERTYHHHHNLNAPGMRHSEVPALLLGYLQFFVNASIVVFVLYLVAMFVMTVQRDVRDRMAEASVELMQEISECTQLYLTNRCDPAVRVPAMESACKTWDICMHRDPTMIGRTNVMAETFAGVINAFVEQISWKTMGFTLVTLSFMVTLANSALFNLRQSASHPPPDAVAPAYYPQPGHAHLGWNQYGQHTVQPMPSIGMMPGHGQQAAGGQMNQDSGVRQIGWEEPKKKGWLW